MTEVINTVAPVFGLIALGWLTARLKLLDEAADKGLASFVFTIAMPALLFRTMATVAMPEGSSLFLLVAFMGAAAATWSMASVMTHFPLRRPMADSAAIGMGATFGNTVMLGIPLAIGHFGEQAIAPLAVVVAVHAPLLWLVATVQNEIINRDGSRTPLEIGRDLAGDLLRNPILIGIVLGSAWRTAGLEIPAIPDKIISYLAAAGIPGALFALGLSLAKYRVRGQSGTLAVMIVLKLAIMPMVAWLLADKVLGLPALWTGVVVILAACPTGANSFLFASRYERAVASVSGSVALGTVLSVVTITTLLAVMPR